MKQIVLMYHDVYCKDVKESGFQVVGAIPYKITKDAFEEQVKAISQYCEAKLLPKSSVVFTFDDGGVSFYSVIPEVLEKYGFKGLFYISTQFIGTEGFLTEEQIRELMANGHEIGAHSHSHPAYDEAIVMSEEKLIAEWKESIGILNRILGEKIKSVSLPNGYSTTCILDYLESQRIEYIYTSTPTTKVKKHKSSNLIGRYAIQDSTSLQQVMAIISNPMIRMKYQIKSDILQIAKNVLGSSYSTIKRKLISKK